MAQQTRPIIGVNVDYIAASKHNAAQLRLQAGYSDAILHAGGLPVIMPPLDKTNEINAFLDQVDGFILSGGLDMEPRRWGQPKHHAIVPMAERREANDRNLVKCLLDRRLPLLAVGLGMQQVNQTLDGELYLHLPEDRPRCMPHVDRCQDGPHRHLVRLKADTRIEEIYGGDELLVNSDHHQAVSRPGEGMRVGAIAPDGVVEAIESVDPDWFCIGVQWHPEAEDASALDLQLFECFVQACIRQAEPLHLVA